MIGEAEKAKLQVGYKQAVRALNENNAEKLFIAEDCDDKMKETLSSLANEKNAPVTYVYYARETLAGNHRAYELRYKKCGCEDKMHMHIEDGMMHGYSCLPVFKESKLVFEEQINLINHIN